MTPPTLHELAGIFMLALATALISHPSAGSHPPVEIVSQSSFANLDGFAIDGVADAAFPAR